MTPYRDALVLEIILVFKNIIFYVEFIYKNTVVNFCDDHCVMIQAMVAMES